VSGCVQICAGVSRYVQVCPGVSRCDQVYRGCLGVSRYVQVCPGVSRCDQVCPGCLGVSRYDQVCPGVSSCSALLSCSTMTTESSRPVSACISTSSLTVVSSRNVLVHSAASPTLSRAVPSRWERNTARLQGLSYTQLPLNHPRPLFSRSVLARNEELSESEVFVMPLQ